MRSKSGPFPIRKKLVNDIRFLTRKMECLPGPVFETATCSGPYTFSVRPKEAIILNNFNIQYWDLLVREHVFDMLLCSYLPALLFNHLKPNFNLNWVNKQINTVQIHEKQMRTLLQQ